jgi:hypothetical protein
LESAKRRNANFEIPSSLIVRVRTLHSGVSVKNISGTKMFGGCEIPEINPGIFEDWRLL